MAFPLAGLLLSLAGTGLSAGLSAINNKKAREAQQAESARREAHYEAKANENPLSRSENQHLLGQYDRNAQQQIENARSMAAITGATPEYEVAVQKGLAENRANLMGQMSAGASARADKYEEMAEGARQEAAANEQAYHAQRNEQYANLAGNALSAFGSLTSASMSGGESAKTPKAEARSNAQMQNLNTVTDNTAPKSARLEAASQLSGGTKTPEGVVLHDTAVVDANANAQKLASATPPKQNVLASGSTAKLTDGGYMQNADGTYTKDGVLYYRNFDGSYAKVK